MKKYVLLIFVLALAACGAGGGSGGGYQSSENVPVVTVPQQRVSANIAENQEITGMVSSVNNRDEMISSVENAIGSDLLTEISKDLDGMADSIRSYSNREVSDRRNSSTVDSSNVGINDKAQTAYAFLEYGRRFRNLDKNNQRNFILQHPEHRNFIMGWGKVFCGCNVNGLSDDQLLNLFNSVTNQKRFDDFYSKYQYKELLLDDARFNVLGFNNGETEDNEIRFVVDKKTGVITGLAWTDEENNDAEVMTRNKNNNGKYTDTFKTIGYKYQIPVDGMEYPYTTDSFSNTNISKSDLREKISNSLNHDSDCDDNCKNAILNAFDQNKGRWVEQISEISYELKGQSLGLRYSDFGYMTMVVKKFDGDIIPEEEQEPDHSVIVGGFNSKQIDPNLFANQTMDFRGTAIGAVAYYLGNDNEESKRIITDENAAKLHLENGSETLILPFNDYYTVTVNKDENGATMAFSDYPDSADSRFKFNKESGISTDADDLVNVQIKYYGDNYVPSEVAGGVAYEEHSGGNLKSFESAFGMKRR